MSNWRRWLGIAILSGVTAAAGTAGGQDAEAPLRFDPATPLDRTGFESWHAFIRPAADELRWREIPWRASFWRAVVEAQESRRPVLLWAMNGHPMGCT